MNEKIDNITKHVAIAENITDSNKLNDYIKKSLSKFSDKQILKGYYKLYKKHFKIGSPSTKYLLDMFRDECIKRGIEI
jgi:hypothetical protein